MKIYASFWSSPLAVVFLTFSLCGVPRIISEDSCSNAFPVDRASCFFAVGGGFLSSAGLFRQPQVQEAECQALFQEYFESGQYWKDTETAIAAGKPLLEEGGNHTQMVVFDIDETCLSNIPLFQMTQSAITVEQWRQWIASARAPAIPATLEFYKELHAKGFSVVFLTGRSESARNVTITNLYRAGFGSKCSETAVAPGEVCYYDLIMEADDDERDATVFKSEARGELKSAGFDLVGSVGDQWSDLLGTNAPPMRIKMPNPLYYSP